MKPGMKQDVASRFISSQRTLWFVGAVALAPVDRLLDMMLGHKRFDDLTYHRRHRHCVHKIASGLGVGFALGRIGGHREQVIGRLDLCRPQRDPHRRRPRG